MLATLFPEVPEGRLLLIWANKISTWCRSLDEAHEWATAFDKMKQDVYFGVGLVDEAALDARVPKLGDRRHIRGRVEELSGQVMSVAAAAQQLDAGASEIQEALSRDQFEKTGEIAERRLGMSSLELHGAHEVGQYMPKAMAAIGTEMHRAASRFAVATIDAAVAGDVKPALAALSDVTRQCLACHSGFRVQ